MTGFTDGEGSFTYSRSGKQIGLYFAIKLSAIDRPLLESIQSFFGGIGRLYEVKARAPTGRGGATKTAAYYRVTSRKELPHILNHFDQYRLQSSKAHVYEVWRLMVLAKQQFRNFDKSALNALAEELSSRVGRNQSWR